MSLDFQQLTGDIAEMASSAGARNELRDVLLDEALLFLNNNAAAWDAFEDAYQIIINDVLQESNRRPYRGSARPLVSDDKPINTFHEANADSCPKQATVLSVDGSQIVPDRHAPYVYYLINTGGIVYFHGSGQAPETFSTPELFFPKSIELNDSRFHNPNGVTIERDQAEMEELARRTVEFRRGDGPLLAIMDQRLLYRPAGELAIQFKDKVMNEWIREMTTIKNAGGYLVGYIDRPMKSSVLLMLRQIHSDWSIDIPDNLGNWEGLTDADLFARFLPPYARSVVFVDVSNTNNRFKKASRDNEICFFYLNTSERNDDPNIARVDVPLWIAQDEIAVQMIHELIVDQCKILGRYPYVLTRADEMAVVGKQDQAELEFRIARMMDQYGHSGSATAKQDLKGVARSGKRAHEF